ncbi:MAG: type I DNA topoisomerase [Candidatus Pacebacteria bacterium]|nr:type I DNA topoisomerase [Candidatus Paceibacterota bacterium]
MQLIIVESPTKAKTISRFLGGDFIVKSSFGHIRDLPKKGIGIDIAHDFKPEYIIPTKAKKIVGELKRDAEKADMIILATDPDREGEAIAWHLAHALGLDKKSNTTKSQRVVFHEITKTAIEKAIAHPREIDQNLVDAQQARRIIDRLVGYKLSPFLWKKIRSGLSAGRVQSIAVRLIVEREREIQKFVPQEYWSVEADLSKKDETKTFRARLVKIGEESIDRLGVKNSADAAKITSELEGAEYKIIDVVKKEVRRTPPAPFTTSTLQQEAAKKLGFSAKQTMTLAQRLYETGMITYMRTDSLHISEIALAQAQEVIKKQFGDKYTLDAPRSFLNKSKGAQEAHEAVRPTDLSRLPESLDAGMDSGQIRLYDLIWKRTIACQMQVAILDQTAADISAGSKYTFRANGQAVKFDGFIRAYTETKEEDEKSEEDSYEEGQLPELAQKELLNLVDLAKDQHFTEPPPRYTDASLIKALEAAGVGRPSTYAPTLTTVQDRGYVEKEDKKYKPTEIGFSVNDMLVENFPEVIDINFTSHIEEEFDDIAEGKIKWVPVVEEFYTPFSKNLKEKTESVEKLIVESTTPCPHCDKMMLVKFGRMGKFLACPEPGSKVSLPLPEEAAKIKELEEKTKGEICPICSKPMEVKRGRFGYFLGCVDYPTCKGIMKIFNKTGFKCPNCITGDVVEKKSRGRGKTFYACSRWPDCTFLMSKKPESEEELQTALAAWKAKPPKPAGAKKGFKTGFKKKTPKKEVATEEAPVEEKTDEVAPTE